jgi:hypothetical protein
LFSVLLQQQNRQKCDLLNVFLVAAVSVCLDAPSLSLSLFGSTWALISAVMNVGGTSQRDSLLGMLDQQHPKVKEASE